MPHHSRIIIIMNAYNIITETGEGEYEEKKSRFIGHALPISSEEEAQLLIDQIKRKYWDARHNCYAYITGERGEIQRFSDDGEPGGTAGRPILDVLNGHELRGVLIVVTRYFGGTLLGTGGLVRAYTKASQLCLDDACIKRMVWGSRVQITCDYTLVGKLQYLFSERNITVEDSVYADNVVFTIIIDEDNVSSILSEVTQSSNGRCEITVIDTNFFVI